MNAFDDGTLQPRIAKAAAAALDGCPWVEKGRAAELGESVAELVMIEVATAFADQLDDQTDGEREIAAIFGCLGPSYIAAERQAKIQYQETKQRLIAHAESLGMTVTDH
jgi:hypothetical protein